MTAGSSRSSPSGAHNLIEPVGSTDHLSFIDAGVPGFNPIQDYVNYDIRTHHTNMDTAERVNVDDLRQSAIVTATSPIRRPTSIGIPGESSRPGMRFEIHRSAAFRVCCEIDPELAPRGRGGHGVKSLENRIFLSVLGALLVNV